jgi:hypothetical protein
VYGFGIGYAIAQHNCVTTLTASISGSREPLEGPPVKAKSTSSGNVLVLS